MLLPEIAARLSTMKPSTMNKRRELAVPYKLLARALGAIAAEAVNLGLRSWRAPIPL
jgi:hypothetical protein